MYLIVLVGMKGAAKAIPLIQATAVFTSAIVLTASVLALTIVASHGTKISSLISKNEGPFR